ncbi:MAG: hypothetical protein ACI9TY_000168 [Alphaproteobacteria bacterium]|jgi:hypothetical protein
MILPNKSVRPIDSLFYISSNVLKIMGTQDISVDKLHDQLNKNHPKPISIETILLCLNYLFIIGKLEGTDEAIRIKI